MLNIEDEIKFDNGLDLKDTIESGQTFLWNRKNGNMFDGSTDNVYRTCRRYDGDLVAVEVEQIDIDKLRVRSNKDTGVRIVKNVLGKELYDTDIVQSSIIDNDRVGGIMQEAINSYPGLRVVKEPLFDTLISFICSTQMRVERIHKMVNGLKQRYGDSVDDLGMHAFPTPEQLSQATVEELRDLKLGYRAGYVEDTVDTFMDSGSDSLPAETEEARRELKKYKGVGTKVADCVLLYAGGYLDVVPVDTWIEDAVESHYPDLHSDSNEKIARNFESFFGEYSGFAQAYMFHYTRDNS